MVQNNAISELFPRKSEIERNAFHSLKQSRAGEPRTKMRSNCGRLPQITLYYCLLHQAGRSVHLR